jgi:hypothetical protein
MRPMRAQSLPRVNLGGIAKSSTVHSVIVLSSQTDAGAFIASRGEAPGTR